MSTARLFAIDVDGTLLRSDKTLAPATIAAVHEVRAAGHHVCIASSRPPHGLVDYLDALELTAPEEFVAYQGAWAGSTCAAASVARVRYPLDLAVAEDVWARAAAADLTANWHADDGWWVSRIDAAVEREARIIGASPTLRGPEALPAPDKILLMGGTAELDEFAAQTSEGATTVRSAPLLLEVTAPGIDKSTGVAAVAERLGVPRERVVAIGDGHNDLALFAWAGHAVAMANAPEDVRAAADAVAPSNDEDGVAAVLRSHLDGHRLP